MRVPDRRAGGGGGAVGAAFDTTLSAPTTRPLSPACASISTRRSVRPVARSPSVSTTSGASRHRLVAASDTTRTCGDEYERIWSQLGSRSIEELIDLPLMSDPASLATHGRPDDGSWRRPGITDREPALPGHLPERSNLSLEQATATAPATPMCRLAIIAGPRFGDYEAGFRFGRLGCELVEQRGLKRFQARTYMTSGLTSYPGRDMSGPAATCCASASKLPARAATSPLPATAAASLNSNLLAAGDPLDRSAARSGDWRSTFARKVRFQFVIDLISAQLPRSGRCAA